MTQPIRLDKPVQTFDGKPARIVDLNYKTSDGDKMLVIISADGRDFAYVYNHDGSVTNGLLSHSLVNSPKKETRSIFVSVYPIGCFFKDCAHSSKEEADSLQGDSVRRIRCQEFTYEVEGA